MTESGQLPLGAREGEPLGQVPKMRFGGETGSDSKAVFTGLRVWDLSPSIGGPTYETDLVAIVKSEDDVGPPSHVVRRSCERSPGRMVPATCICSKRLLCQEVERQLVGLAVEVFEQGILEDGVGGGSSQKQGHAGPEFQIVRVGKDLFSAATVHVENKLRTCSEPWDQDWVLQIGLGFVE